MDLQILAEHGVSTEAWRKVLDRDDIPRSAAGLKPGSQDFKIAKFCNRVRSRAQEGQRYCLANYQTLHAVDQIWDAPFQQITPTLLQSLLNDTEYKTDESVLDALKGFGFDLDKVFIDTGDVDAKTGKAIKKINVPVFFKITVPLVRSYLTIRKAKLLNDRNVTPFIHYKPVINTPENRAKCQVLTNRAQLMAIQYGYATALDQAIFQMLLYPTGGTMFTFEDWHTETQLRYKTTTAEEAMAEKPKRKSRKESDPNPDDYEEFVVREGLRFHVPHPSRVIMDRAFSPRTINTDTGVRYCGYWKVVTYGEILDVDEYYNVDRVSQGDPSFWSSNLHFFQTVYNTCVLNAPIIRSDGPTKDREQSQIDRFYSSDETDRSIVLFEYREKLVPSEHGLGDYDHPIWARFVLAGDGTIVFAQPIGYTPATVWKDNGDDKRTEDSSLALNLSGFEHHFSNLFTQYILTAKQNLMNLTLIDENVMTNRAQGKSMIERIKNLGERFYRTVNIFEFDSKKLRIGQTQIGTAFYSHRFPPQDPAGIAMSMKLLLDIAERVMQFSAQEVAQQATHEQTRTEVVQLAGTTTNILDYTGFPVDQGLAAMGKQIHEAWNNYGEDDFATSIPSDTPLTKQELEKLGFTLSETTRLPNDPIPVKAKKNVMDLPLFAIVPATRDRQSNAEAAQVLATFVRDLMSNPITAQALGPDQAIDLANQIAKLAGLPLSRDLRNLSANAAQDLLQQVVAQVLPMVKDGLVPVMQQIHTADGKVDALYKALGLPIPGETNDQSQSNTVPPGPVEPAQGVAPSPGGQAPPAPSGVPVGPGPGPVQ